MAVRSINLTNNQYVIMKRLKEWIHLHPLTLASFAWSFGSLSAALAFREDWAKALIMIMAALFGLWVVVSWWQMRGLTVLLALSLATTNLKAAEPPPVEPPKELGCAAVAVGAVVVVVGIVVGVKLIKFCQKKFPKDSPTNAPPEEAWAVAGPSINSAALEFSELGSCDCNDQSIIGTGETVTTTTLTLNLSPTGELTCQSVVARTGPESAQGWAGLAEEASAMGLALTGHAGNFCYARDGSPITVSESVIQWDWHRQVVKVGRGSKAFYTVSVDRSPDLINWIPLTKVEVEVGSTVVVHDTNPVAQQFYRYESFLSD